MKYIYYTAAFLLLPFAGNAQVTVNKAGDFTAGTVLKFQQCDFIGVYPGAAGANVTWNFSNLSLIPDTMTEWMVLPSSTPKGNLFPTANLAEKYSDGSYVYMRKTQDSNYMVGFADSINNMLMHYHNEMLISRRPFSYGDTVTDNFKETYTISSYNMRGAGSVMMTADAYGTLILPNGTYNNVLRIKLSQVQNDTLIASSTPFKTTILTYLWFDNNHRSALLKIDSTHNPNFTSRSVQYLISEFNSIKAPEQVMPLRCYPNPASTELLVESKDGGTLTITNILGEIVAVLQAEASQTKINTSQWAAGVYTLTLQSGGILQRSQVTIR